MEFFTATIFSGIVYDMLKYQVLLSADNIKSRLKGWIVDDLSIKIIEQKLEKLQLTNELSELEIEQKLKSSEKLLSLLSDIKKDSNTVVQTHSGSGDNIAGNKNINYK